MIRIVPYSRSLAVDSDGGYLGASLGGLDSIRFGSGPILRLWFNSTDRLIELFVVFAGWLSELSSSGSSNGRLDGPLLACRSGASLGREDIRKEG